MTGGPRWTGLSALGFLMVVAGAGLMLLASVAWGLDVGEDLPFFVAPIVLGVIGAIVVRGPERWRQILAIVLALLVVLALFWTIFGLATPASFFDVVPGVLVLPGALLAIGGAIAAMVRHDAEPSCGERRALVGIPAAALGLALLSGVVTLTSRETVDESEADVVVQLSDFEFDEDLYRLEGGSTVLVRNDDPFFHTFTIDDLGIDEELNPGSEKLVTIPDEAGAYVLYCVPHTGDTEQPADDDMASRVEVS
jgi:plastocyanin